jgi:hypothetical protein
MGSREGGNRERAVTLLGLSAPARLAIASVAASLLWAASLWALS